MRRCCGPCPTAIPTGSSLHGRRGQRKVRVNGVTPADYLDWRARNYVFASLTAHDEGPVTLTGQGTPERLLAVSASTDMLATYGVQPLVGRDLLIRTKGREDGSCC